MIRPDLSAAYRLMQTLPVHTHLRSDRQDGRGTDEGGTRFGVRESEPVEQARREQIAKLIAQGKSQKDIAHTLGISKQAVSRAVRGVRK